MTRRAIPLGAISATEKFVDSAMADAIEAMVGAQQVSFSNKGDKFVCSISELFKHKYGSLMFRVNVTNTEETSWTVEYRLETIRTENVTQVT